MPEPNVLYTVTAVVVTGLVAWVAYTLKTAKEPWSRAASAAPAPLAAPEAQPEKAEEPKKAEGEGAPTEPKKEEGSSETGA